VQLFVCSYRVQYKHCAGQPDKVNKDTMHTPAQQPSHTAAAGASPSVLTCVCGPVLWLGRIAQLLQAAHALRPPAGRLADKLAAIAAPAAVALAACCRPPGSKALDGCQVVPAVCRDCGVATGSGLHCSAGSIIATSRNVLEECRGWLWSKGPGLSLCLHISMSTASAPKPHTP
jgi:hypothetical protein